jgi:ABC-2 type transport system permease protein
MLRETWALTARELKHWYRVKIQIFMTLIQPIVWLGLFGQAFNLQQVFQQPGIPPAQAQAAFATLFSGAPDYFSFMALGMLAVNALFTCMFSGMSIVWDRRFGFLNKLKVAPIPRGVVPLSRILATVIRSVIQVTVVLIIALAFLYVPGLTGLSLKAGFGMMDLLGMFLVLFLLSVAFASLFTAIALAVENQETLFGVINLLNLPLMFASAALFPLSLMPEWLQGVAKYNPLTWASDALRQFAFVDTAPIHSLTFDILGLLGIAALLAGLSVVVSRKLLSNK